MVLILVIEPQVLGLDLKSMDILLSALKNLEIRPFSSLVIFFPAVSLFWDQRVLVQIVHMTHICENALIQIAATWI